MKNKLFANIKYVFILFFSKTKKKLKPFKLQLLDSFPVLQTENTFCGICLVIGRGSTNHKRAFRCGAVSWLTCMKKLHSTPLSKGTTSAVSRLYRSSGNLSGSENDPGLPQ